MIYERWFVTDRCSYYIFSAKEVADRNSVMAATSFADL